MRGTPFLKEQFVGGLNTVDSPYTIQDGESRDCLNVVSSERGAIKKRYGSTLFTGTPPPEELHSICPVSIAGVPFVVAAGAGKIFSVGASGTVTEIGSGFSASARLSVIQAEPGIGVPGQGPVYMLNGVNAPQYWTGTGAVKAWTGKSAESEGKSFYAPTPHVPNGKYMVQAGGRVWITGISGDTSAVRFCDTPSIGEGGATGDPTAWPTNNVVRFDPEDGYPITGIGNVGPYVVVFKAHKTWVIHDLNTGANRKISDSTGCVAHRSIVETPTGTFFLTADQGVYATDGLHVREMSYPVKPTILAANPSQKQNAAGGYLNNHYYLSFGSGSSNVPNRTLDYDLQLKSWWLHDLAGSQWAQWEPVTGEPALFTVPAGPAKGIVKAFVPNVYTDVGAVYAGEHGLACKWISPWEPFAYYVFRHRIKAPFLKKRVRAIFFNGSGTIIPMVFKDFNVAGSSEPAVIGARDQAAPSFPAGFQVSSQEFGNPNTQQLFGGATFEGVEMLFGGSASTGEARIYAPGVARVWGVGWGNNDSGPAEVDSYAYFIEFRKS